MTLKLVFMGTPDFGVPCLNSIIEKYNVEAIFTQPDKPRARGQKMQFTPVKEVALRNNIQLYAPIKLRNDEECIEILRKINPDIIIVIAYGQILPPSILEIPRLGCVNLHASLLPDLRGAAPINWSIINGNKTTGNTTMLMGEGLDTGDILLKSEVTIGDNETAGELYEELSCSGVDLLIRTIEGLRSGTIIPEKQDDNLSSYASKLTKQLGHINWDDQCGNIYNLIRGVTPWPGAFTFYGDKVIKICRAQKNLFINTQVEHGQIIEVSKLGIEVACRQGSGSIIIKELQEVGGKKMDVISYLNGHTINKGDKLK